MGVVVQDFVEKSFDKKLCTSYSLSILIGMDSLFYLISDRQNQILALHHYSFLTKKGETLSLKESIQIKLLRDELLRSTFKDVTIGFALPKFTLLPRKLYNENEKDVYLKNIIKDEQGYQLLTDHLEDLGVSNIYPIKNEVIHLVKGYFPVSKIYHNISSLFLAFKKEIQHQKGKHIFINVQDKQFLQLLFLDGKELIFSNFFEYKSSEDFIYYVLMVYSQFRLKPEVTPVTLAGHILPDSDIYRLLFRYIRHIRFVQKPNFYRYGKNLETISEHFYYDLYSLKVFS